MNSNLIGRVAWGLLGLLGLVIIVDLGFGPIVICPQCGGWVKILLGFILVAVSAAAFLTNRKNPALW
jgi:hypothetical protein